MITHSTDAAGCGWVGASFTPCPEPATWIYLDENATATADNNRGGWAFCDVHARRTAVNECSPSGRWHRTTNPPDPTDNNATGTESHGVTS